jgi:ATP adenylyltransferase
MTPCKICDITAQTESDRTLYDTPVYQSEHFLVLPTVGALIEDWLLLVPKCHCLCIGTLPDSLGDELRDVYDVVRTAIKKAHPDVVVFEHGPAKPGSPVGCSVDHAHLHFVGLPLIRTAVQEFTDATINWCRMSHLAELRSIAEQGKDYLFFEDANREMWVGTATDIPSQLFRKVAADYLGRKHQYDWRTYPFPELANQSYRKYDALFRAEKSDFEI